MPPAAVEFGAKKNNIAVEGPDGLVCTARLPLSSATLSWLADLIRGHLKKIGSRWRALPAGRVATIVLAVLRCDQRPGDLAGGNGIHRTTVTRWVREAVGLLAARAPRLERALKKIARTGGGVVLLDGSVIRTRRRTGKENRRNYSGKNKCHGPLVIALTDDRGRLLWISTARLGRTSEITACRHDKLTQKLREAGLGAIADLGFVGLDDAGPDADPAVTTGYKAAHNRPLTRGQKLSNKALAAVRAPVEHDFAHLKNWRVLGKVRTDPRWATALVRALLVLTNRKVAR
ncbi:transposase family protein [Streptomyces viridosporus]|uniref:transposase family protein n=1 Tax=Streptomyces viridosporus TaxID=67581 RepID=UPI0009C0229E|nr:transposase family protein [Streptomyces viridosporus]